MIDGIQLRDNAMHELLQIKDLESGITYLNKIRSIEVWVKAEKKDAELQNMVAEQKLRTQRILGQLIQDGQERGEIAKQETGVPDGNTSTLDDIGISRKQSSTFQQIASIPEQTFEDYIKEKKEAVNNAVAELTTTGAVKLAKSLKEKREDVYTENDLNERLDLEREIRALAVDLKKKYKKEMIELLVKLLTK